MQVVVIGATGNVGTATDTIAQLIEAMRRRTDYPTPPLDRATSGRAHIRELVTGVAGRP
jgi:hypothetical protein